MIYYKTPIEKHLKQTTQTEKDFIQFFREKSWDLDWKGFKFTPGELDEKDKIDEIVYRANDTEIALQSRCVTLNWLPGMPWAEDAIFPRMYTEGGQLSEVTEMKADQFLQVVKDLNGNIVKWALIDAQGLVNLFKTKKIRIPDYSLIKNTYIKNPKGKRYRRNQRLTDSQMFSDGTFSPALYACYNDDGTKYAIFPRLNIVANDGDIWSIQGNAPDLLIACEGYNI